MLHEIETGKGQWMRAVNQYRSLLNISWKELKNMEKKEVKIKIREYDSRIWREEMQKKTSLKWYRQGKENIGYDKCYSNNISST